MRGLPPSTTSKAQPQAYSHSKVRPYGYRHTDLHLQITLACKLRIHNARQSEVMGSTGTRAVESVLQRVTQ